VPRRVQVRTYIDAELRDAWEAKFTYASYTWVLETAIREVLKTTKDDPSLADIVQARIKAHIMKHHFQPNPPKVSNVSQPSGA
jgi:hypothetical protein